MREFCVTGRMKIRELYLDHAKLAVVPSTLGSLHATLESLTLHSNCLELLPGTVCQVRSGGELAALVAVGVADQATHFHLCLFFHALDSLPLSILPYQTRCAIPQKQTP